MIKKFISLTYAIILLTTNQVFLQADNQVNKDNIKCDDNGYCTIEKKKN